MANHAAILNPHLQELKHLLTFITSEDGAVLTKKAAAIAYDYHTNRGDDQHANNIQVGVAVVVGNRHSLFKNGRVDFSWLTPWMIKGLWEVCALTSNPSVKQELSKFNKQLEAPQHDFFASLAGALNKLRES